MDDEQPTKKRKFPWQKAYSKISRQEIEERIGMTMRRLASTAITVEEMLVQAGYNVNEEHKDTKEEVYKEICRYLRIEGHYWISSTEANINDLVYAIVSPVIDDFISRTGRDTVQLYRERQLVSVDSKTGGYEEFVVLDRISVTEAEYILIIEAKTVSLGAAMGQCLLALKDMGDSIHGGIVYGFVTTGGSWRMLSYDGRTFKVTDKIEVVFDIMARNDQTKEKWMKEFSVLVDCVYAALSSVGKAKKDEVSGSDRVRAALITGGTSFSEEVTMGDEFQRRAPVYHAWVGQSSLGWLAMAGLPENLPPLLNTFSPPFDTDCSHLLLKFSRETQQQQQPVQPAILPQAPVPLGVLLSEYRLGYSREEDTEVRTTLYVMPSTLS
ncbi:hypothetical protein BGX38DRAFT_1265941 [Terfezia claveryi]|nr:hypothetical protein BGX38DRAFT_1279613 [Terfezia claveryi]KAF8457192.1 hypothetical protein BGX38DRAFT_1265941 [Terfezia claveryi]